MKDHLKKVMKGDSGELLIETLMTLVIVSVVGMAVLTVSAAVIKMSKMHENMSVSTIALRNAAEKIAYSGVSCPATTDFTALSPATVTGVKFWDGTNWTGACNNSGVQKVTLKVVVTTPNQPVETRFLDIVVRKP